VAQKGGVRAVKAIPMSTITSLNRAIGGRIIVKWTTKTGVVRLGTWIPLGIGIGLGAAANATTTEMAGRAAKKFFDDSDADDLSSA
jgi:hypothetical protein